MSDDIVDGTVKGMIMVKRVGGSVDFDAAALGRVYRLHSAELVAFAPDWGLGVSVVSRVEP